jgi:gliding motility-associated-like protein
MRRWQISILWLFLLHGFSAIAQEPTAPATNAARQITNCNQVFLSCTPGNGSGRIIIMRAINPVSELPQDGVMYTANSTFGLGSDLGNGNFVVYRGGGNSALISGLQAGTEYHFAIFEYNGINATINYLTAIYPSLNIPVPPALSIQPTLTQIDCHSNANGSISLQISGGTLPYTIQWNTGSTADSISGLAPGLYAVTVSDPFGCTLTDSFLITQPAPLEATGNASSIDCFGDSTGTVTTQVSGGTAPYQYNWNDGAITQNRTSLPAGNYAVTITDANNCQTDLSFVVTQNQPLLVQSSQVEPTCYGEADGSINLQVSGGIAPYSYQWNTGEITATLAGITAGTYTVTITDLLGCTTDTIIQLMQPDSITVLATITPETCIGKADGNISITISGGTPPYIVDWSNGASSTDNHQLPAGLYNLLVTDQRNCEKDLTFEVPLSTDPRGCLELLVIYEVFSPNGDGNNETWVLEGLENYPNNRVEVFNRWGQPVFASDNYQNNWNGTTNDGNALPAGTYYYILTLIGDETISLSGHITFIR